MPSQTVWANIIGSRMTALGVSNQVICALVDVGVNRLGQFLSGAKDLDNHIVLRIYAVIQQLEQVQEILSPVPVDWKNVRAVKEVLERVRTDGVEGFRPAYKQTTDGAQSAQSVAS